MPYREVLRTVIWRRNHISCLYFFHVYILCNCWLCSSGLLHRVPGLPMLGANFLPVKCEVASHMFVVMMLQGVCHLSIVHNWTPGACCTRAYARFVRTYYDKKNSGGGAESVPRRFPPAPKGGGDAYLAWHGVVECKRWENVIVMVIVHSLLAFC